MLLLAWLGCTGPAAPPPEPGPVVVLVSWDTTRADALGAYADVAHWGLDLPAESRPTPRTPHADALAASGVRFQWALAHAPTTLNSHTSVFSGRDPHQHRVPRNGFPVPPDVPLLAERMQAAGWDTIGVVGASVLESGMGLSRGFRVYDDRVGTKVRRRFEDPADRVVERVFSAVDARPDPSAPLLLFAHFFDAHSPWDTAPERIRATVLDPAYTGIVDGGEDSVGFLVKGTRRGVVSAADHRQARAAYLAEVAFADEQLGRLLEGLDARGYGGDRLVVLFGDHGETLDEIPQRAYQHGFDVDLVDIHVPLIVSGRGAFATPVAAPSTPVSLSDIAPTVLALAGVPGSLGEGRDLRTVWTSPSAVARPHFAEATKPGNLEPADRWNNLPFDRTIVDGDALLSHAPVLKEPTRLFQLAPGQPPLEDTQRALALTEALARWDAAAPPHRDVSLSAETEAGLKALGYLEEREGSK